MDRLAPNGSTTNPSISGFQPTTEHRSSKVRTAVSPLYSLSQRSSWAGEVNAGKYFCPLALVNVVKRIFLPFPDPTLRLSSSVSSAVTAGTRNFPVITTSSITAFRFSLDGFFSHWERASISFSFTLFFSGCFSAAFLGSVFSAVFLEAVFFSAVFFVVVFFSAAFFSEVFFAAVFFSAGFFSVSGVSALPFVLFISLKTFPP